MRTPAPGLKPQQDGLLLWHMTPQGRMGASIQLQDGMLKPNLCEQAGRGQRQPVLLGVMGARHCRAGSVAAQKPAGSDHRNLLGVTTETCWE